MNWTKLWKQTTKYYREAAADNFKNYQEVGRYWDEAEERAEKASRWTRVWKQAAKEHRKWRRKWARLAAVHDERAEKAEALAAKYKSALEFYRDSAVYAFDHYEDEYLPVHDVAAQALRGTEEDEG